MISSFASRMLLALLVASPALATTTTPATSTPAASKPAASAPATSKPAASTPATSKPAASTPPGHVGKIPIADRFTTTAAAAAHCPGDVVVWSTLSKSGAYHLSGSRYYGKTKHGAYVCETDAKAAGFHQSKE